MRVGGGLPEPSPAGKRRLLIVPPVQIALNGALYEAWREAGVLRRRLAHDIDVAKREVRSILTPDCATKAATIDRALRQQGKRLTVTVAMAT